MNNLQCFILFQFNLTSKMRQLQEYMSVKLPCFGQPAYIDEFGTIGNHCISELNCLLSFVSARRSAK